MLKRFGHPRLEMSHHMEDPMTEWILNPHSLEPIGTLETREPVRTNPLVLQTLELIGTSQNQPKMLFSLRGVH